MDVKKYLETHKDQYNYCEAVVFPDGTVEDARPSHTEMLLRITGEDREVIYEKMPMSAGPVAWLVDYTNCCSIWYNFGMLPENMTDAQEETIKILKDAGQLSRDFVATKNFEMRVCALNNEFATADEKRVEEIKKELNDIFDR